MKIKLFVLSIFLSAVFLCPFFLIHQTTKSNSEKKENKEGPEEWLYNQRAWPSGQINYHAYFESQKQARLLRNSKDKSLSDPWTFAGPINIGGRITDIEMPITDTNTIYVGTASGGIFKTTNHGSTWTPLFDNQLSLSIGDLAIDPGNANTIYAGTGEANASSNNGAFPGDGIYKSTNAGSTWTNIGLPNSQNIGRIVIDPLNSNNVFVAVMGKLYGGNPERGVYRSTNAGSTWQKILFVNDSTGCIDLAINPTNPSIVYAAMWQRVKYPFGSMRCGAGSGIYKSVDGGTTWSQLTNGLPASNVNTGRIGIDISKTNPSILYGSYSTTTACTFDGVYKTTNGGTSWSHVDNISTDVNNGYGWYFGNVRVDPTNSNVVYILGLDMWKSTDGGINWNDVTGWTHVDHHALLINPLNTQHLINGNDGGLYLSFDGSNNWNFVPTLPITQFYACEIDYMNPTNLYGGSQDNSTERTLTGNLDDWEVIYGGDGFYVLVDPTDNNYVYCEYQYGQIGASTDGGFSFNYAMNGINPGDRMNWNTPFVIDPSNPQILYYGSNYLYKSTDRAVSWNTISGDLTDNIGYYSSITTIAVAPTNGNVIYVGTDDANVWVTNNCGSTWTDISSGLPTRYVSRVAVAPDSANVAYVTFSGYRNNDYLAHVFRTKNYGATWQDISGNLPEGPINDIIVDPLNTSFLYVATDVGVFVSMDWGGSWQALGVSMPLLPVCDLTLHNPTRTLVAGTYGRSMYKYDLGLFATANNISTDKNQSFVYPNPFSDKIYIDVDPSLKNTVQVDIYSSSGMLVKTFSSENINFGSHLLSWDATNNNGIKVKQGVYLCRISSGKKDKWQKFIYMK